MQTLEVRAIHRQLIGVLSGDLGGLFPPKVAAHAFSAHQLTRCSDVYPGLSPFVCFKFWHLPVLLVDPVD